MRRVVFYPGIGKGRCPRAKTPRDQIERRLIRMAALKPADPVVAMELEDALALLERQLLALDRHEANGGQAA